MNYPDARSTPSSNVLLSMSLLSMFLLHSPTAASATSVQILGLEAIGADLEVSLAWSESIEVTAPHLAVRNAKGAELLSVPITALAGETTVAEIPGALSAVAEGNLQFFLAVLDEGDKLATPLAFRVRFDCSRPDACEFEVVPGLRLNAMIDLSPELAGAIDGYRGKPVDLLTLGRRQPELLGDVYSYAYDLERRGVSGPSLDGCTCAWTAVANDTTVDCGAYAMFSGDELSHSSLAQGELEIDLELRCTSIEIPERIAVTTPAGRIAISPPTLVPCETSCVGMVAHDLNGNLEAWADAGFAASAQADLNVEWEVDGALELAEILTASVDLPTVGSVNDSILLIPAPIFRSAPTHASVAADAHSLINRLSAAGSAQALSSFHGLNLGASGYAACAVMQEADLDIDLFCTNKAIGLLSGDRP
ncbi:MAG: hypothetical protein AAF560_09540 [Acidobacteriota bacterium]